ncbi:MAG TPA: NUDIX hydrolase [Phaeodactylibacter sp.]|nr:NUDIX hydrolase [Phaeodactylibacter sp.]
MATSKISLTVDAIVFGYEPKQGLSVLLVKRKYKPFKGKRAIPGGFVLENESLEDAVKRELQEEAGIQVNYLEQLYTFGEPKRDPRKRIVTVAYYGLVRSSSFELFAATDAEDAQWFYVNDLPKLAFDHQKILDYALERLQNKIAYQPIGFELLDEKFTMEEVHHLYETIYHRKLDRRNFRKKFLKLDILEELKEKSSGGRGRPGSYYRFDKKKYFALQKKGMMFEI